MVNIHELTHRGHIRKSLATPSLSLEGPLMIPPEHERVGGP